MMDDVKMIEVNNRLGLSLKKTKHKNVDVDLEQAQLDQAQQSELALPKEYIDGNNEEKTNICEQEVQNEQECSSILDFFRKSWPDLFNEEQIIPLRIGILKEITKHLQTADDSYSNYEIRKALNEYCNSMPYLKALIKSPYRLGLNGEKSEISEDDRMRAIVQLRHKRLHERNVS